LAQEPPCLLTDGGCRERQSGGVRLQQFKAVVIRGEEVAELIIGLRGLRQDDLDEAKGRTLQPVLPPLVP
jgi:hypothetical protein